MSGVLVLVWLVGQETNKGVYVVHVLLVASLLRVSPPLVSRPTGFLNSLGVGFKKLVDF